MIDTQTMNHPVCQSPRCAPILEGLQEAAYSGFNTAARDGDKSLVHFFHQVLVITLDVRLGQALCADTLPEGVRQ